MGRGFAHAAYPCAVLRDKVVLQSYYVCLLAMRPLIAACAQDLHARGTGARLGGYFGSVASCVCWLLELPVCDLAVWPGLRQWRSWWRLACCGVMGYPPVPGSSQRGAYSRRSQGLGCGPCARRSGHAAQPRGRGKPNSTGRHISHPKVPFLAAQFGQASHTRAPFFCDLHTFMGCLLYTSPSPRDRQKSRMPSSA